MSVPFVATIHAGLSGFIKGCIPSNGTDATNDINFSVGTAFDGTRAYAVGAMTKRADAGWAFGTAAGGMASVTGTPLTFSATTDYHWFVLLNPITGETDYGCDTSVIAANLLTTAAVMAHGFTIALRVSSLRTIGSAAWPLFSARMIAIGLIEYLLKTPAFEHHKNWTGADNAEQTATLSLIPGGIKVNAILGIEFIDATASNNSAVLFSSFDQDDTAPSSSEPTWVGQFRIFTNGGANGGSSGELHIRTSTSRTLRYRTDGSTADHLLSICSIGWEDSIL